MIGKRELNIVGRRQNFGNVVDYFAFDRYAKSIDERFEGECTHVSRTVAVKALDETL